MHTAIAMSAPSAGAALAKTPIDLGPLRDDHVEIAVSHCGICHSDLSMLHNDWGISRYPLVPGHEAVGTVAALGSGARGLRIGQRVGLGWYSSSCMHCRTCLDGDHNLCPSSEATMIGRPGGFATRVRAHWAWAVPLPERIDAASAGPLFCGGITVFNPIVQHNVRPTERVGVVGIGGLGHLALQFLRAWGCDVTAFSSSDSKRDQILAMGAHRVVSSRDEAQMAALKGSLDFLLVTVNVPLNWNAYLDALAPRGRLHLVGAVLEPIPAPAMALISGQKAVSGTPLGSPATTQAMLDFAARHRIAPITESFPMSRANDALDHLRAGKARYRVVLANDLA
ncbi:MAG: alcohol dehydrogenase [Isosphaera sp.]|nr:alcohol dehydrogenase [Isosphaera sp.]